ncbi:stage V sporulation protein AD [Halalkalibacter urbisdiaboli]|uniref:stage V sporulation protein AD n=1 Tax=Halalkalibacter urbisdiaboli TaxID=1960589 RepID=UPI000B42F378|nr:stage V sporulation protein AD [Halalkalibacter urbisdiaboli]
MKRLGKQTWSFTNSVYVQATGTVVGPTEAEGPLRDCFDRKYNNLYCGEDNWELAERKLLKESIDICLEKKNRNISDVDFFLAGDLLNQTVTSNYVARTLDTPFLGMFSACATSMETLAVGSMLIDGGYGELVLAATSSHHSTAERQFRYPTEFGGQRPETSTFTVTGAGAVLIGSNSSAIRVKEATIGKVVDMGIMNPFDMGAAMAPAAAQTIQAHLRETKRDASYYDYIVTGDLSRVGSGILRKLLQEKGIQLNDNYDDCGVMIYSPDQPVFAGGSGPACAAVVTYGHLLKEMNRGNIKRLLVVATGALLSPLMIQQKESIPCIAHAVSLETEV